MAGLTKKQFWLRYFLDKDNRDTFLNRTESARAAGYECQDDHSYSAIGSNNYRFYEKIIQKWMNEEGLTDLSLKCKLITLLDAKETKFFAHEGVVTDEREVECLGIQAKALDMALKVKGSYAAQKTEVSGPGGGPVPIVAANIDFSKMTTEDLILLDKMFGNGRPVETTS